MIHCTSDCNKAKGKHQSNYINVNDVNSLFSANKNILESLSICLSVPPSVHPSARLSVCPSIYHAFIVYSLCSLFTHLLLLIQSQVMGVLL